MNDFVRFLELEEKTIVEGTKQKALWLALAFGAVAFLFLTTTIVGLLSGSPSQARTMLMINGLLLGPVMIAMVSFAVGTADILQHLLPKTLEGGEIHTSKWVKITAQVVATDAAILMIPSFWTFQEQWVFVLVVALVIVYAYSKIAEPVAGAKK